MCRSPNCWILQVLENLASLICRPHLHGGVPSRMGTRNAVWRISSRSHHRSPSPSLHTPAAAWLWRR
uniref:Uncharacterized protein n=1 Tax=Anguilla anguilla TaxID=7936 RepID=A0A0E9V4B7_ANGAN